MGTHVRKINMAMAQSFVKMKIKTNSKKNKKNVKDGVKNKFTNAPRENDTTDLMSPEDMELLKGIDEGSEDEIEFDSDGEGEDVDPSEIAEFIKKLGVAKHRPDTTDVDTDDGE